MSGVFSGGVGPMIVELPLQKIRRPLMRTRSNDKKKVKELMDSIRKNGLQVPVQLLCRLTKFGCLDDDRFRDVVNESTNFLEQGSSDNYAIGLRILDQLVQEMNQGNKEYLMNYMEPNPRTYVSSRGCCGCHIKKKACLSFSPKNASLKQPCVKYECFTKE